MMEAKTITLAALIPIVATLSFLGGMSADDLNDDGGYYCESSGKVMPDCDKLTQYYGLDNGKCWNSNIGNKLCRTGWLWIDNADGIPIEEGCVMIIK